MKLWIVIAGVVLLVSGSTYAIWRFRHETQDFAAAMTGARACPAIEQRIGAPYDATPFPRCKASRRGQRCVVLAGPRGKGEFRYRVDAARGGIEMQFTFGSETIGVGRCAAENVAAEKARSLEGCAKNDPDACERAARFTTFYADATEAERQQAAELREKAKRLRAAKP